jgi:hypothetical protein
MRRFLIPVLACAACSSADLARAIPLSVYLAQSASYMTLSIRGYLSYTKETALLKSLSQEYLSEQSDGGVSIVGQPLIGGSYPTAGLLPGATTTLAFDYVDTATGLPTGGPPISYVLYEASVDPGTPGSFVVLGSSSDAGSNFSLPFTATSLETMIEAIPYDSGGNPIVLTGLGGENVAVGLAMALNPQLVPEPSSWVLAALAGAVAAGFACIRRLPGGGRKFGPRQSDSDG